MKIDVGKVFGSIAGLFSLYNLYELARAIYSIDVHKTTTSSFILFVAIFLFISLAAALVAAGLWRHKNIARKTTIFYCFTIMALNLYATFRKESSFLGCYDCVKDMSPIFVLSMYALLNSHLLFIVFGGFNCEVHNSIG